MKVIQTTLDYKEYLSIKSITDDKGLEKPGIYKIKLNDSSHKNGIQRLEGTDNECLLYIGMSKNLRNRIND